MTKQSIPVLLVDDNRSYREAFARNLEMMAFSVLTAENGDEAVRTLEVHGPMVMVTDLDMRTETEGLDLIREARVLHPLLPVIMISAVGTFEEGALAHQYGATHVIHKSRIEEELEPLYDKIHQLYQAFKQNQELLDKVADIRAMETPADTAESSLQEIMMRPGIDSLVKGEAYDVLLNLQSVQLRSAAENRIADLAAADRSVIPVEQVIQQLSETLPFYHSLQEHTRESLNAAEFLFAQQSKEKEDVDFSRNIGFSYCFAVENEVKHSLRRKMTRFIEEERSYRLLKSFMDQKQRNLDLSYHQYLLRALQATSLEVTTDNIKQTFQRILQHKQRYKPDGLKAVGIVIFCFGRTYNFRRGNQNVEVRNPLNLKMNEEEEGRIEELAASLIGLQHYRNPYIHPEISDAHKISKVRETAMECLQLVKKIV